MANTNYYKTHVEPEVRKALQKEFGVEFSVQFLKLDSGGEHEFDAVSVDKKIVTSIKSSSGKTSGGKRPSAKISIAISEIYFLSLVKAEKKILVLTDPEFYEILLKNLKDTGKLHPDVELKCILLPKEMQDVIDQKRKISSKEVKGF